MNTTTVEPASPADGSELRVLVAEDVAVNRELIRLMLKPDRYRVDTVCDGAAAIEAVKATRYDVVLMDMQMPGVDGLQATRAIRALGGANADMPIIALSANIIPDQVQRCLEAGMTTHLPKPFTSKDLCEAVDAWGRASKKANDFDTIKFDTRGVSASCSASTNKGWSSTIRTWCRVALIRWMDHNLSGSANALHPLG